MVQFEVQENPRTEWKVRFGVHKIIGKNRTELNFYNPKWVALRVDDGWVDSGWTVGGQRIGGRGRADEMLTKNAHGNQAATQKTYLVHVQPRLSIFKQP